MRVTTDESCPECGELLDVETAAEQSVTCGCSAPCDCYVPEGWRAYDGDPVSCSGCGWQSRIVVSDDEALIMTEAPAPTE